MASKLNVNKQNIPRKYNKSKTLHLIQLLIEKSPILFERAKGIKKPNSSQSTKVDINLTQNFLEVAELQSLTKLSSKAYLDRLIAFSEFPISIFISSGFLLLKLLCCPKINIFTRRCRLKVFAACLNLSQKFLMDKSWSEADMAYLTGIPKKSLCMLENLIYFELFEGKLGLNFLEYKKFRNWLKKLPQLLQDDLKMTQKKNNDKSFYKKSSLKNNRLKTESLLPPIGKPSSERKMEKRKLGFEGSCSYIIKSNSSFKINYSRRKEFEL